METNSDQSKLSKMAEIAKQRFEADRKAKSDTWIRIKEEMPDTAEFLTNMGKVFGRLAKVEVTTKDGDVLKIR